jgi:hypothetical protein
MKKKSLLLLTAPGLLALITLLLSMAFFNAAHAAGATQKVSLNTYPSGTKCVQINEGNTEGSSNITDATTINPDGHGNNVLEYKGSPVKVNIGSTYYFKLTDTTPSSNYTCSGHTLKIYTGTVPHDSLTYWHLYL